MSEHFCEDDLDAWRSHAADFLRKLSDRDLHNLANEAERESDWERFVPLAEEELRRSRVAFGEPGFSSLPLHLGRETCKWRGA